MGVRGTSLVLIQVRAFQVNFRALWKDVDWTLAETAEHLSGD